MAKMATNEATEATGRATHGNMGREDRITIQRARVRGVEKFCVSAKINGSRSRTFFESPAEAAAYRDQLTRQLHDKGAKSFAQTGLTVAEGWREFSLQRLPSLRGNHRRLLEWWIGHYVAQQGRARVAGISPRDIDAFLDRPDWSGTTRAQGYVYLRLFFNWLVRYEHLDRSPVLRAEVPRKSPQHHLLTVAEVRELLRLTKGDNRMRAWLVLGLFGGMRQSEVGRCLPEHVEKTEIFVPVTKSTAADPRPRFVPILPALRRHLPKTWDCLAEDFVKRRRNEIVEAMGWQEWPQNCLRHTAASMHLADCRDAGKTAFFLGHSSPQMVHKTYARAVREHEARAFWAI
jgi:integrase